MDTTSTTIATATAAQVNQARKRQHTNTASPTTAADGPVSVTYLSESGSPSGLTGPIQMPIRAYIVPASVAR